MVKSVNYSDGFIGDQLVFVYIKYGCAEDAQMLFDECCLMKFLIRMLSPGIR